MELIEPIELLKSNLKLMEKAINKSTVSNYNKVSNNLNPWIEKYKKAIELLQKLNIEKGCSFDEPVYNPECKKCGHQNSSNCNTCDVLNPQFR